MTDTATQDAIREIAALARARRLDEAALLAARVTVGNADPVLAALAGAVEFHRGQFERAVPYLRTAHSARPDDLTVRANLAESLYRCGQADAALALADPAIAKADPTLRLARLGAGLAQEREDFALAAELFRHVVAKVPDDWSAWNNLGNALAPLGETEDSIGALETAARLAPDSPPIRANLGNALIEAGRGEEGEAVLRTAATDFPDDATALTTLYGWLRDAGREDEAYAAIAEAARRAPGDAHVRSDHGQEAARINRFELAEAEFEAALAIEPALGASLVGLATVYERVNRETELEPLRLRAAAAGADGQSLAFIDALRFKRAGQIDEAFEALERAGDAVIPARKLHLRGTMLDRLDRADEAFAAFREMNELWQAEPSQPLERAREYRDAVAHSHALLSRDWLAGWTPPPPPDSRPTPVFLVGFPRSGTTLLDTMLMSAPGVAVLEEEPFIAQIESELGGIDALPALDQATLVAARDSFFDRAATVVETGRQTLVIDKHPMHLNKVPVIRRLFPDAKFILALRHPCDVLLSCYLTNFRTNPAMANFLDMGLAAELYDRTFAHWQTARGLFDLPVRTVVYERLVEDQARELRPLFDWLGLDWPEAGIDHRTAARARGAVSTASYSQVTEPVYTRARGRWHRYSAHLEPVLPVLKPWADQFGYSMQDGRIPPWP
jgi:Flp pilus assembly protein TadD